MRLLPARFLALLLAALCLAAPTLAEEDTALSRYLRLYGAPLPQAAEEAMQAAFVPATVSCGGVTVTFTEALWDGRWLYTACQVQPDDPSATLLLPGSAWAEDLVRGGYGETTRDDDRTFAQAALADGKRLLSVYAYPGEFDGLPEYFLDHLQEADPVSTLFSGAILQSDGEHITVHWSIQVREVDPADGSFRPGSLVEASHTTTIPRLGPVTRRTYTPADPAPPLEGLTLTQTALTVYTAPAWTDGADARHRYRLLDADSNPLLDGMPPEADTYALDALPDTLHLQFWSDAAMDWLPPTLLTAIP